MFGKSSKIFGFLAASSFALFLSAAPAFATTYDVKLANGNTIKANSYRVEKGKVFLGYPVGEGAFSLSQVISVTAEGGSANLLQSQGVAKPAVAPAENQKIAPPPFDPAAFKKNVMDHLKAAREASDERKAAGGTGGTGGNGPAQKPFASNPDPERDALINQLANTDDEAARAAIEKKLFENNVPEVAGGEAVPETRVPISVPQGKN